MQASINLTPEQLHHSNYIAPRLKKPKSKSSSKNQHLIT